MRAHADHKVGGNAAEPQKIDQQKRRRETAPACRNEAAQPQEPAGQLIGRAAGCERLWRQVSQPCLGSSAYQLQRQVKRGDQEMGIVAKARRFTTCDIAEV